MASRPLGITLLVFGVGVTLVGGVILAAPGVVSSVLSPTTATPTDPGLRPELPVELAAAVAPRSARSALDIPPLLREHLRPVSLAPEVSATGPVAVTTKAERGYAGDAAAREALLEAEKLRKQLAWEGATAAAQRVETLDAHPALKLRARTVVESTTALAALFKALDDRDELSRNYDTHPSLVRIEGSREAMIALPIRSLADKDPVIIERDPLTYITQARSLGKVPFLVRGRRDFFATGLTDLGTVTLVDQKAVQNEKRAEFIERLSRLTGSSAALDPVAWFEAGKFAYRNRLDDLVVPQLDRALQLDPQLVRTVREDRAGALFAHLMAHMKTGNKVQAAAYLATIERRYKDTEQGRQARLYFDGKQAELLKAAQDSAAQAATAAVVASTPEVASAGSSAAPEVALPAGTTPEARADQMFEQGREVYARAIDMGNSRERDTLYGEADRILTQAVDLYSALVKKEKDPRKRDVLEMKLLEANKLRFGTKKQRRF